MILRAVELVDFRNVARALVEPHPRVSVFSGDNGQGKTNLLEAVYLVGTLATFRASRADELIRFGCEAAHVRARLERRGLERKFEVEVASSPTRKLARVDGKAVRATADHFGGFNVVLFAADDLQLPRGAPSERRRFLDRAIWNAEPAYWREAADYQRVLRQRNAVLREAAGVASPRARDLLDVYDEQLAATGAVLVRRRTAYLAELAPRVESAWSRITRTGLAVGVAYQTKSEGDLAGELAASRGRDFARGFTGCGPHTDDVALAIDGHEARLFGSQGQLRALVLALKIAEIEHLETVLGEPPILLLDDVSSELDPQRNAYLFAFLREVRCQVLITTTHPLHVQLDVDRRDFAVVSGTVRPVE